MARAKGAPLQTAREETRRRLREFAARVSQADIARRTGTAPANVHRYLQEGKVPVDFCALLVREFQVNPAWLLAGEGAMLRADVSESTRQVSDELLALVESMNAIAGMRMGAVASSPHRKSIRELNESMEAFERIRDRLNLRTSPALAAVLNEFEAAMRREDMQRAGTLRVASEQLSRMCLDESLHDRLDTLLAWYCYTKGEVAVALNHERRRFSRLLLRGRITDSEGLKMALWMSMSLRDSGLLKEALRVVRAARALAADAQEADMDTWRGQLAVAEFSLCGELGRVHEALQIALAQLPSLSGDSVDAQMLFTRLQMLAGLATWEQALIRLPGHPPHLRQLLRMACAMENASLLAKGLREFVEKRPGLLPADEYDTQYAMLLRNVFAGRKASHADVDRIDADFPPRVASGSIRHIQRCLHRAQVARLAGQRKVLRKLAEEAERAIETASTEDVPRLDWLIARRRNLAACGLEPGLRRVDAEIDRHVADGCRYLLLARTEPETGVAQRQTA